MNDSNEVDTYTVFPSFLTNLKELNKPGPYDTVKIEDNDHLLIKVVNPWTPVASLRVLINGRVHPRMVGLKDLNWVFWKVFGINPNAKIYLDEFSYFFSRDNKLGYWDSRYHNTALNIPDDLNHFVTVPINNVMVRCVHEIFDQYCSKYPYGDEELLARLRTVYYDIKALSKSEKIEFVLNKLEEASTKMQELQMENALIVINRANKPTDSYTFQRSKQREAPAVTVKNNADGIVRYVVYEDTYDDDGGVIERLAAYGHTELQKALDWYYQQNYRYNGIYVEKVDGTQDDSITIESFQSQVPKILPVYVLYENIMYPGSDEVEMRKEIHRTPYLRSAEIIFDANNKVDGMYGLDKDGNEFDPSTVRIPMSIVATK